MAAKAVHAKYVEESSSITDSYGNQAVEPMLSGEWTQDYCQLACSNLSMLILEQVDMLSVQCLMKKDRKALYALANCYLSLALGFHMYNC